MTFNSNNNQKFYYEWNPFTPTKRDIKRTEELADKNPIIAGVLTFLYPPFAMIYLNRGINNLKIIGYIVLIAFTIGFVSYKKSDKELEAMGNVVGIFGRVAMIAENTRSITLARKRLF